MDLKKSTLKAVQWQKLQEHATITHKLCGQEIQRHLYDLGFWNLLQHYLTEADDFLFLHDALGYESLFANWNAAQAIPNFLADFDVTEYWTLKNGMEQLPQTLKTQFKAQCCACPKKYALNLGKNYSVIKIKLGTESGKTLFYLTTEDNTMYSANQVILALPKEALKSIKL